MKKFNVTGICIPDKNYMVDISQKLDQITEMVEDGKYFTINRARQYGKTTTLAALDRRLSGRYHVIWLSFEGVGETAFQNDHAFVRFFIRKVGEELKFLRASAEQADRWCAIDDYRQDEYEDAFDYLSRKITSLCEDSEKEFLLMIDEVDKSPDNQIFLNFLGMLRNKYLFSGMGRDRTFKSVILSGVYDVKNLKLKLRPDEEKKYNSPWNIAADFDVDMSFSPEEIATMLREYETDHHTGMDIDAISEELYFYTGGYPFLVSCLCKWVDEKGKKTWTKDNLRNAEKALLKTRNTLFDDLIKNVENYAGLRQLIMDILYSGAEQSFTIANPTIDLGVMLGIFKEKDHMVAVSNVIFETYLYDYVVSVRSLKPGAAVPERSRFVKDGRLDMVLVLEKFQELMRSEYRQEDGEFLERQGRLLFLCFLKPIINGIGFYYVEPETRNRTRMDVVVVYGREEYIIELKIWRGGQYRSEGIRQLEEYLENRNVDTGYLLSFSFLKNKDYRCGWMTKEETEKHIFEAVI